MSSNLAAPVAEINNAPGQIIDTNLAMAIGDFNKYRPNVEGGESLARKTLRDRGVTGMQADAIVSQAKAAVYPPRNETLEYLRTLFVPGDWINIQLIHQTDIYTEEGPRKGRKKTDDNFMTLETALDPATKLSEQINVKQSQGWNVYVAMNAFTPNVSRRREIDIKDIRTVYIEFDEGTDAGNKKVQADIAAGIIPDMDFCLQSSEGKAYFIWLVEGFDVKTQKATNKALQVQYGSDPASVDAARVLRLPGTLNLKYDPYQKVVILYERDNHTRVRPEDFKIPVEIPKTVAREEVSEEAIKTRMDFYEKACEHAGVFAGVLEHKGTDSNGNGLGYKYVVECPNYINHTGQAGKYDGSVWISPSGHLAYGCFHNSCKNPLLDWTTFYRPYLEAQAKENGYTGFLKFGDASEVEGAALKLTQTSAPSVNVGTSAVITPLSKFTKKKITWLWKDRIPSGTLCTIAGDPDEGKSLVTLYLAACVSQGLRFFGDPEPTPKGKVLILSAEDDPETTLRPRLEAAGADVSKVLLFESVITRTESTTKSRLAQLDADISVIKDAVENDSEIKLIIIDPISSFLGKANMIKETEVREVLQPLVQLSANKKLSVIMVAHFNKGSHETAMNKVGGAKAIVGQGRAAWVCCREAKPKTTPDGSSPVEDDRRLFLKLKSNLTSASKTSGLVYQIRTAKIEVEDEHGKLVSADTPFVEFIEEVRKTAQDVLINKETVLTETDKAVCS